MFEEQHPNNCVFIELIKLVYIQSSVPTSACDVGGQNEADLEVLRTRLPAGRPTVCVLDFPNFPVSGGSLQLR